MKPLLLITLLFFANVSLGQTQTTIYSIDFVKIKSDKTQEALFFYENNWKVYRDIALQKGFIKSYKLLTTSADTIGDFDLILMTEYSDSLQYKESEENFQQIIKATRPNGPKLLNELKPNEFRQNLMFKETKTLFYADRKYSKRKKKRKL